MDVIGPMLALGLGAAEIAALWAWGVRGTFDRTIGLVGHLAERVMYGRPHPPHAVLGLDYQEIARLERELFSSDTP